MKVQKLNKQVSPFAGISFVNYYFNETDLSQLIDSKLGMRGKNSEYNCSDIIINLANVFFSGGDIVEGISTHLGDYLKTIPNNKVPSPDTVLRGLKELTTKNTTLTSDRNILYNFNINKSLIYNLKINFTYFQ